MVYFNFLRYIREDQVSVSQEATHRIVYSITSVIMTSILELYLSDVSFYSRSTLSKYCLLSVHGQWVVSESPK